MSIVLLLRRTIGRKGSERGLVGSYGAGSSRSACGVGRLIADVQLPSSDFVNDPKVTFAGHRFPSCVLGVLLPQGTILRANEMVWFQETLLAQLSYS